MEHADITHGPEAGNHAGRFRLIAHRGGVVESRHPENSAAAVVGAIERGYAMVEIDVRVTADGEIVCLHEGWIPRRLFGRSSVAGLELAELRRRAGGWILTLDEMAQLCEGRIGVMIDTKVDRGPGEDAGQGSLFPRMKEILDRRGLLSDAYFIGTEASKRYFAPSSFTAVAYKTVAGGERPIHSIGAKEFIFGHGNEIAPEVGRQAISAGVRVVPSVNRFHYLPRRKTLGPARQNIERLADAGCTEFQIDSEYDSLFRDIGT